MLQHITRRVLLAIPVLFGIMLVTFFLSRMIPGDPCRAMLGEKATADVCARFTIAYGLDKPIPVQFAVYLGKIIHGDFGNSIRFSRPVMLILAERLPMTIELGFFALILSILVGIPAGIISAVKRNSPADVVTMVLSNMGVSMPVYWLGLLLAYTFALLLKDTPFWLPPSGRLTAGLASIPFYEVWGWQAAESGTTKDYLLQFFSNLYILNGIVTGNWKVVGDAIKHLILPAIALGTIPLAIIARMTRSSMLEVLKQDYIRTARAKGLQTRLVILKHALRNAMLPIVTVIGLEFGILFAGALLTESIFGLAGVGRILYEAITARDFPIIQAFTVVIATGYVVVNLLVDISYVFIDPRIRLE
jgi:peptide/nickel transport system permease protein